MGVSSWNFGSSTATFIESSFRKVVIAYEPVWAIGTGKNALPSDVVTAARYIRAQIKHLYGEKCAEEMPVLYGGSVTADSAADYIASAEVDGLLVGGASLDVYAFNEIIKKAHKSSKLDKK